MLYRKTAEEKAEGFKPLFKFCSHQKDPSQLLQCSDKGVSDEGYWKIIKQDSVLVAPDLSTTSFWSQNERMGWYMGVWRAVR